MPGTQVRVSEQMNNVTTILVQQRLDNVVFGGLDISQLSGKSNTGDVLKALLEALGYRMSADGKRLWHDANPRRVLQWQPTTHATSRLAAGGSTTAQRVEGSAGAHDAEHAARGSRWAVTAAADARPGAPLPIMRVPPAASARIAAGGSGWGNTATCDYDLCQSCGDGDGDGEGEGGAEGEGDGPEEDEVMAAPVAAMRVPPPPIPHVVLRFNAAPMDQEPTGPPPLPPSRWRTLRGSEQSQASQRREAGELSPPHEPRRRPDTGLGAPGSAEKARESEQPRQLRRGGRATRRLPGSRGGGPS
jgi:hypothetical protein